MQSSAWMGLMWVGIVAAAGVVGVASGCATGPVRASQEGCARARLSRERNGVPPAPFVGCFVDDSGAFVGTLVLTDVEDSQISDDEPRRFQLGLKEAPTDNPDARWELLAPGLVRLTFPGSPLLGFQEVEACVEGQPGKRSVVIDTMSGSTWARIDRAPFIGPPSPVRLRRVPCTL